MKRIIELINPMPTPEGFMPSGEELEFTRSMGKIYARMPMTDKFYLVDTLNIKRLHISETTPEAVLKYLTETKTKIQYHDEN